MKEKCKEEFDVDDGPFIKALDNTLAAMNVHRQAYYGGTFIGNHASRYIKVHVYVYIHEHTRTGTMPYPQIHIPHVCHMYCTLHVGCQYISATLPRVAACPQLEDKAQTIANKYGRVLLLYSKCHGKFNCQERFSEDDCVTLRKFTHHSLCTCLM